MLARSVEEALRAPAEVTELSLSHRSALAEVPETIRELANLTALDLSFTKISRLPGWVGSLRKLTRLELTYTEIIDLPAEIGDLPALEELALGSFTLRGVPEVVARLRLKKLAIATGSLDDRDAERIAANSGLRELAVTLQRGSMPALPRALGTLAGLQKLEITSWNGDIGDLSAIEQLGALVDLEIQVTGSPALPPGITGLTKLERLKLEMPAMRSLPEDLDRLSALRDLEISRTPLPSLPEALGGLQQLTRLSLHQLALESLPRRFGDLAALKQLTIWNTPIRALPTDIERLTSLEDLDIERCPIAAVPPGLCELPALRNLVLNGTALPALPPEIGALQRLQTLVLWNSPVAGLPAEVGELADLSYLNLANTKIRELPAALGKLATLDSLDVSKSPIDRLPAALAGCAKLSSLSLTGCNFCPAGMKGLAALRKKRPKLRVDEPRAAPPTTTPKKTAKPSSKKKVPAELAPAVAAQLSRLGLQPGAVSGDARTVKFPRGEVALPEPLRRFYDDVDWPCGDAFAGELEASNVTDVMIGENASNLEEYECIHHKPYLPVAWSGEFCLHYVIDLDDPKPADPKVYLLGAAAYRVTTPRRAFDKLSAFLAKLSRK
jgi:Leucine-rich repeat (LRR) protein